MLLSRIGEGVSHDKKGGDFFGLKKEFTKHVPDGN
jgi:hypothetical protein